MDLLNATKMVAGYAPGIQPDGRELVVVVVKGTFDLPKNGDSAKLAAEQLPLVEADTFTGEPGFSAPLYESDYAPYKPFCDVIVNGSAYAPGGQFVRHVRVGIKVGQVAKSFNVFGNRKWEAGLTGVGVGPAQPFVRMPFSYDVAFGGTDRFSDDESNHDAFMQNPSGVGYRKGLTTGPIDDLPMPNTEALNQSVKSPLGEYEPMSLGPIARGWPDRAKFAGTYDDEWLEETFPFLPEDFDNRYFQFAPQDQQTDYLKGGESVTLVNLTADGRRTFEVPKFEMPVVFFRDDGEKVEQEAVADTLYIEPDFERFIVLWRTYLPLKRNLFEIPQAAVGKMSRAWWRARELGKTYYPNLATAVRAGRRDLDDAA